MLDIVWSRLGFIIDLLSHATIEGFMTGAVIVVSLQQLKGILGLKKFTQKINIVSVITSASKQVHKVRISIRFSSCQSCHWGGMPLDVDLSFVCLCAVEMAKHRIQSGLSNFPLHGPLHCEYCQLDPWNIRPCFVFAYFFPHH